MAPAPQASPIAGPKSTLHIALLYLGMIVAFAAAAMVETIAWRTFCFIAAWLCFCYCWGGLSVENGGPLSYEEAEAMLKAVRGEKFNAADEAWLRNITDGDTGSAWLNLNLCIWRKEPVFSSKFLEELAASSAANAEVVRKLREAKAGSDARSIYGDTLSKGVLSVSPFVGPFPFFVNIGGIKRVPLSHQSTSMLDLAGPNARFQEPNLANHNIELLAMVYYRSMRDFLRGWCKAEASFGVQTTDPILLSIKNAALERTTMLPLYIPVLSVLFRFLVGLFLWKIHGWTHHWIIPGLEGFWSNT